MNRIYLAVVMVLAIVAGSHAAAVARGNFPGPGNLQNPTNVAIWALSDADVTDAYDSLLETGDYYVAGPFPLGTGNAMITGFQGYYPKAVIAAGDSIVISYQILPGLSIKDTVTTLWTAMDTIAGDAGKIGTYVSLASKAGASIVFRVYDLDATAATVSKVMRIIAKRGETYNR